jgi:hypothetical protein
MLVSFILSSGALDFILLLDAVAIETAVACTSTNSQFIAMALQTFEWKQRAYA